MAKREATPVRTEPTQEEISAYLKKVGEKFFSPQLRLMAEEPFRAAGEKAESEGWFIGDRAVMQGLIAAKLSEYLGHSNSKIRRLTQAASLTSAMRRVQYETYPDSKTVTTAQRESVDIQGQELLKERGIDEDVIRLTEAGSTVFPKVAGAKAYPIESAKDEEVLELTATLLWVHDSVAQTRIHREDGKRVFATSVVPWEGHLENAEETYPTMAKETYPLVSRDGSVEDTPYFDVERSVVRETEAQLKAAIQKKNNHIKLGDEPLALFIKGQIDQDILSGAMPHMPRKRLRDLLG
jgi:hypothetical protein